MKKVFCTFVLLAIVLTFCACGKENTLRISVLKTGKADAIIVCTDKSAVLIDTGEDDDGDKVLEEAAAYGIDHFDYLILSHYDKDHVGGAAQVIRGIPVGQIIEPGYEKNSDEYHAYHAAAQQLGIPRSTPKGNLSFELDGAHYEVYMPEKDAYDNENDHSIAVKVTFAGYSALFTGDALDVRMTELMAQDIKADVLKVPHHGEFESCSEQFFQTVSPKYAVITCSEKNPADEDTLAALTELECNVLTTERQTVRFVISESGVNVHS